MANEKQALSILEFLKDEVYGGELSVCRNSNRIYAHNDTDYFGIYLPDFSRGDCLMTVVLERGSISYKVEVIKGSVLFDNRKILSELERKFDIYSGAVNGK